MVCDKSNIFWGEIACQNRKIDVDIIGLIDTYIISKTNKKIIAWLIWCTVINRIIFIWCFSFSQILETKKCDGPGGKNPEHIIKQLSSLGRYLQMSQNTIG